MSETDYVENMGGLPLIKLSIERDKINLDVIKILIASTESRSDPEV